MHLAQAVFGGEDEAFGQVVTGDDLTVLFCFFQKSLAVGVIR